MAQPRSNDHSNLAALDFSSAADNKESAIDALRYYAPAPPKDTDVDLTALHKPTEADEENEEDGYELFTVTNPRGTVSVSAQMGGQIHSVELSEEVTTMAEPNLAEEIFVIADLVRQKARAAQYTFMTQSINDFMNGEQTARMSEFVGTTLNLPTPEEAAAAQDEVFASRYGRDSTQTMRDSDLCGVPVFGREVSDEYRDADW